MVTDEEGRKAGMLVLDRSKDRNVDESKFGWLELVNLVILHVYIDLHVESSTEERDIEEGRDGTNRGCIRIPYLLREL